MAELNKPEMEMVKLNRLRRRIQHLRDRLQRFKEEHEVKVPVRTNLEPLPERGKNE